MQEKQIFIGARDAATQFSHREGRLWLARLCGVPCGPAGEEAGPPQAQGMALLRVDGRRYEAGDLKLETVSRAADNAVLCRWRVGEGPLRLSASWQACAETGIVSRRDTLTNAGDAPALLSCCLARVAFPPGAYECYSQASRWCHENQGAWQRLHAGLQLRHLWGRTTEGATPYLALRPIGARRGVGFHVLPRGNWTIRVGPVPAVGEPLWAVVELGLADENLNRLLQPGESLELPEVLFQPLPEGQPHLGAPLLHRYLLRRRFADAKAEAPVVYNAWYDRCDALELGRLRAQLAAAKEVGCEVFVVDAGWYGPGATGWWSCCGDWREKTGAAFRGRMRAFAEEVRRAGLGFGLWMEPERFSPSAPVLAEHPEWFVPVGEFARMDLTRPPACAWLRGEIGRLVETYGLAWMKVDFNFPLDADASGAELYDYTAAWHRVLDEVRASYPDTFFEGCSSGGMRCELATLSRFDAHFLSDTVNPTDMLRISQGAWLRLPPGRITRWAVMRPAGQAVPGDGAGPGESSRVVLTPRGFSWELAETADLDFVLLAAMPGMFALSGDLAGLPAEHRAEVASGIRFYKKWRRFIVGAMAHLLTPPEPLGVREGWVGLQLQRPEEDASLVFVYRLGDVGAPPALPLCGLDAARRYVVRRGFEEAETAIEIGGGELMRDGPPMPSLARFAGPGNRAEVFCILPVS